MKIFRTSPTHSNVARAPMRTPPQKQSASFSTSWRRHDKSVAGDADSAVGAHGEQRSFSARNLVGFGPS